MLIAILLLALLPLCLACLAVSACVLSARTTEMEELAAGQAPTAAKTSKRLEALPSAASLSVTK